MKAFFHQLFDYNFYCNRMIIELCTESGELPGRSPQLFSHILNAHHIWNKRMLEETPDFTVWQGHKQDAWEEIHYENQRSTFEIITNTENFDKRIDYMNSQGETYTNSLQDMLFHIINHSTHHRAQLAAEFREAGLDPLVLDYVFYKR